MGAGPGDPELLTRKAARRLAEADLVLYDALVSPAAVSLARRAQRVFVGRRRGSETMGQDAIIRTLIRAARRGRRVVRLKGGDPFVFGRGGEEALALKAAGVRVRSGSRRLLRVRGAGVGLDPGHVSRREQLRARDNRSRPRALRALASSVAPDAATLVMLMGTRSERRLSMR